MVLIERRMGNGICRIRTALFGPFANAYITSNKIGVHLFLRKMQNTTTIEIRLKKTNNAKNLFKKTTVA
jgi:hypothetical protein